MALQPMNMNQKSIQLFGQPKVIAEELLHNIERIQSGAISTEALQELDINTNCILAGPPGVGKTAIANYLGQEMIMRGLGMSYTVNCSSLLSSDYGGSPQNVANLFASLQQRAEETPVFVFIDEADAALAHRTESNDHRDGNRALTEFLKGFDSLDSTRVFIIIATNRIDILDPAIIRRFIQTHAISPPPKTVLSEYMNFANERYDIQMTSETFQTLLGEWSREGKTIADLKRFYSSWMLSGKRKIDDLHLMDRVPRKKRVNLREMIGHFFHPLENG